MKKKSQSHLLLFFVIVLSSNFALAAPDTQISSALKNSLKQVVALVNANPSGFEKIFDPSFLKAVPPDKLAPVFKEYFSKGGKVIATILTESKGSYFAEYRFHTQTSVFNVKIGIGSKSPHLITTLWFGPIAPDLNSFDEILAALKKLPGKVSFALWQLDAKGKKQIKELNPELALGIGSAFKLYILGALLEDIVNGKRNWSDIISLNNAWKSLPSGVLQRWPEGAPITLYSLAGQMISISDNTATDHLLYSLGRERVEGMLKKMGNKTPERTIPFFSTKEMFHMKSDENVNKLLPSFIKLKAKDRRALLDNTLMNKPISDTFNMDFSTPIAIEQVEWFASAADLCRAMDWIRNHASGEKGKPALDILGINNGLSFRKKLWKYIGYKGGSETGVLNLTWLLQKQNGKWFALSAGWNNTQAELDEEKFEGIIQSLILFLEKM